MKIPFHHIKDEVKRIDKHNEKNTERIEKHHESEREAASQEILEVSKSKGFQKEVEYNRRHPGHLQKVLRKVYGEKAFPRQ